LYFNAKITDTEHEAEIKLVRERIEYHHRLIILHEILNDVITFKELKDPDTAKDYTEKLAFFNHRKNMIAFLNSKYGAGTRLFLDILSSFRNNPHSLLQAPDDRVRQLIRETQEKLGRERVQPFEFRNRNMGDMLDVV
jgi:hypothetical protein